MLGMQDPWIAISWLLSLLSMIGCIIYGAIKWNTKDDDE